MFAGTKIVKSAFDLYEADSKRLIQHSNRVVSACERLLKADFSDAACEIEIKKINSPLAFSYGNAFGFKEEKIVRIQLYVDAPDTLFNSAFVSEWFHQTLSHEWHHGARALRNENGCGLTIGEALISEGLAVRYQEEFTGIHPWLRWPSVPTRFPAYVFTPMTPEQLQSFSQKIVPELSSLEDKKRDVRLYDDKQSEEYPHLCGYAFGDWIVGHYLYAHKTTATECVGLSADKIIGWFLEKASEPVRRAATNPPPSAHILG
jgi:hypothetical protein